MPTHASEAVIRAVRDRFRSGVTIDGFVSDIEILSNDLSTKNRFLDDVRWHVTVAVAGKVMEKLAPAIDKAFQEAFKSDAGET